MKINYIEITDNPILGNLKLDFRIETGVPANTVIFAGENGCGKSVLLNILYEFSTFTPMHNKGDEKRLFSVTISDKELEVLKTHDQTVQYFQNGIEKNILEIKFDFSVSGNWSQITIGFFDDNHNHINCPAHVLNPDPIKYIFRSIFSDIGIDFTPRVINTITSRDTDQITINSERTTSNLANDITQLLIDIEALDSSDFKKWADENINSIKQGTDLRKHMDKRMYRFKQAFKIMFNGKKQFLEIRNEENKKMVYFKEGKREMPIELLSSGEKQIVFRGGFLLKDQNNLNEEFVLIDEPEISLHPNWQLKIISFYKNLFKNKSNIQKSQLFIATHSPFIIHSTDKDDIVIILKKNKNGDIKQKRKSEYFGWTPEQQINKAFNIDLIFSTIKPIIITEGKSDYYILTTAWEKLYPDDEMPFDIIPAGIETSMDDRTGNADQVRRSLELMSNLSWVGKAIIGLFDNDRMGNEQFKGLAKTIFEKHNSSKTIRKHKSKKIAGMILPVPSHRTDFVTANDISQRYLEIEHYFDDSILSSEGLKGESILA